MSWSHLIDIEYLTDQATRGQWEQTQDELKLNLYRNLYGTHAPVRLMMERKIVAQVSVFIVNFKSSESKELAV